MEKIGYVYLTTNLVNGKQYVGQHLSAKFDKRYKGSGHAITNAINKYGWDNFKCEVICWCSTQTQLNEAEDNYIRLLNTMKPNGYNLRGGGSKGRFSKETRKKLSESKKKYFENEENRRKASEAQKKRFENVEARKKLSEVHKGKKVTEETRKKHSEAMKKYWKSEEARKKQSEAQKDKKVTKETRKKLSESLDKYKKKVLQYTKDGEFVKEWESLHEIERQLGYNIGHISYCCHGKLKSAYDFIWKFADNTQQETF